MKYTPTVDIGSMTPAEMRRLQPGQWVYTGENAALYRGRFWGIKPSGTIVVAWQGNAKRHSNYQQYQQTLRHYAIGA